MPYLVSGRALDRFDQAPGCTVGDELAAQMVESIDRCRFEASHFGEMRAKSRAASGRRRQ